MSVRYYLVVVCIVIILTFTVHINLKLDKLRWLIPLHWISTIATTPETQTATPTVSGTSFCYLPYL